MKNKKNIIIVICIFLISLFLLFGLYVGDYYRADNISDYLKSSDSVKVVNENGTYFFDGDGYEDAIVFYQGGKVENKAYAPLLYNLALNGVDCILVKMPFNLAIFDVNKADSIINNYSYKNWYLAGHSLGGTAASMYVSKNEEKVKGLILLASYSTNKIDKNIDVLSIYGSLDGVLNMEKYHLNKDNLTNLKEVIIEGGNHAYFGCYGEQKKDNKASITRKTQQDLTIKEILSFVKDNK